MIWTNKASLCHSVSKHFWWYKPYQLKKDSISGKRVDGGLEMIDYFDINNTFKLNWLRNCLKNDNAMWFFIPQRIFQKLGGLSFLLRCNFLPGKLPFKWSKFHQQVLLAWKICFHHNLSPHKMLFWNNCLITSRKKIIIFAQEGYFWKEHLFCYGSVLW